MSDDSDPTQALKDQILSSTKAVAPKAVVVNLALSGALCVRRFRIGRRGWGGTPCGPTSNNSLTLHALLVANHYPHV